MTELEEKIMEYTQYGSSVKWIMTRLSQDDYYPSRQEVMRTLRKLRDEEKIVLTDAMGWVRL